MLRGQQPQYSRASRPRYLLDRLQIAAGVAFSTRLVRLGYAGPLLRVRRSSDSVEQDIGQIGGQLDIASLLTFCGASSGFIVTWYDQSGAGIHATQATQASQPRIVNAGVLDAINGRPAVNFMGTGHMLFTASIAQPLTTSLVGKQTSKASGKHFIDGLNASPRVLVSGQANWIYFAGGTPPTGSVVSDLNPHVLTNVFNAASSQMFVDGTSVLQVNAGTNGMGSMVLGGGGGGLPIGALDGYIAECIVIPSALSADARQTMRRHQGSAFGIAVA